MSDEQEKLDPQEDRRADLEAAIASVEADEPVEPVSEPVNTPSASPADKESVTESSAPILDESQPQKRQKPASAPIDWAPELKEQFGTLPEPFQRAIHQQEVRVNQVMQQTTEARRLADNFVRTVEPYRMLMQAEGVNDPLQAVDGLLKTATTLSMGSQTQKAQRLAQLVQHYGVDIEALDKALAGTLPTNTEEDRLNRLLEQRLQPYNQIVQQWEQAQQYQQYEVQQNAIQHVNEMAQNPQFPYFEEVRTVMADFVDLAAANGQNLSLEDAYQRACMAVPHVAQQFVQQRSNSMLQGQQNLGKKQNAASSIVGRANSGQTGKPDFESMSIRETLMAQMGGSRI